MEKYQKDQNQAIDMMLHYIVNYNEYKRPFVFAGLAGTGKTHTMKELLERLDTINKGYELVALSNRACKVLSLKTGREAHTICSAMKKLSFYRTESYNVAVCRKVEDSKIKDKDVVITAKGEKLERVRVFGTNKKGQPEISWYLNKHKEAKKHIKELGLSDVTIEKDVSVSVSEWTMKDAAELKAEFIGKVIIVDESSMVSWQEQEAIAAIGVPVIFVGDSAQLPPIYEDPEDLQRAHISDTPDFELTEVVRSASKSGIPAIGRALRFGEPLLSSYGTGVRVFPLNTDYKEQGAPLATIRKIVNFEKKKNGSLQERTFLCFKNDTVDAITEMVREEMGYLDDEPRDGEKIMTVGTDRNANITKNEIFEIIQVIDVKRFPFGHKHAGKVLGYTAQVRTEEDETRILRFYPTDGYHRKLPSKERPNGYIASCFAYAMTTHRSQGSSFAKVSWINDTAAYSRDIVARLAYTGATRAEKELHFYSWPLVEAVI